MLIFGLLVLIRAVSSVEVWTLEQLEAAKRGSDYRIVLRDISVPAGLSLNLEGVKENSTIEFAGNISFGFKEWKGHLVRIKGRGLRVLGKPGHVIDGGGQRWWDGLGGNGGKIKPGMIYVQLNNSYVDGLHIKNSPRHVFAINACNSVHFSNIFIDDTDGHRNGGHNTDGFDLAKSNNIKIVNSTVINQDDCLAINSGYDIVFENNTCIGGHGIAVAVGGYDVNKAEKILIRGCKVIKNNIGIRVKTLLGGVGLVKGITFDDIQLRDITNTGIVVIGNYLNSGPRGLPTPDLPIQDLHINNVRGNVLSSGANVHVWVANASNWLWNSNVHGGKKKVQCMGIPLHANITC